MIPASAAYLLAVGDADPAGGDVVSQLLGYGVPGLMVILIITQVLVPGWVVSRQDRAHTAEIDAKDQTIAAKDAEIVALRAALDDATVFVRDQVMPALTRSAEISRGYVEALNRRAEAGHG